MAMEGWQDWAANIREAKTYREGDTEKWWDRWRTVYQIGRAGIPHPEENIRVYLIRSIIQILLPSLYFRNPYVVTRPIVFNSPDAVTSAAGMEAWINYYISGVMNPKKEVRRSIIDALVYNKGYIANKWVYDLDEQPMGADIQRLEYGVVTDAPAMGRKSPWAVLYDPYSLGVLEDSRWCSIEKFYTYDALKENKKYNRQVVNRISGPDKDVPLREIARAIYDKSLKKLRDRERGSSMFAEDPVSGLIRTWEIYDRKYDRYMLYCPQGEGFLEDGENPYSHLETFPLRELIFEYDTDRETPSAIIEQMIPQQKEMNDLVQRQHDSNKRFARIMEVEAGNLADPVSGKRIIEEAKDGTMLEVLKRGAVGEIEWNNTQQPEWWRLKEACRSDALFSVGIPPTQTSTGHSKFKSATEVAQIAKSYDIRLDDMREQVVDWFEKCVTDLGKNIQQFQEDEKSFQILGETLKVGPEALGGEFEYQALLSEDAPENKEKRLERLMLLYQLARTEPLLNRVPILQDLVRGLGTPNPARYFVDIPQLPGNIPAGQEGGAPTEPGAGAMAMAPPGAEQALMGGIAGGEVPMEVE